MARRRGEDIMDFIGKRNYFFALSIALMIAGLIGYFVNGLQLDIQFQGGTIIEMQMNDNTFSTEKAEEIVKNEIGKKATAQKSQTINSQETGKKIDILSLSVGSAEALSGDEINKVVVAIRKDFNVSSAQMNVQNVQPFIGRELRDNAIRAIIVSSVLIILYIWMRFQVMSGLAAGVMAVLALLHDAAIMLAVYTVFKIPINESFIAAVLTILGYSMNDTIIIYDRIRENSRLLSKTQIPELVNKSIMQTLARSINTIVTVLICVVTVYAFAVFHNIRSMEEFSFPLIVGIASGCYSSIFIACPLWVMWKEAQAKKRISSKPKPAKA